MQYIVGLLSFLACTFLAIVDEAKDSLLSDAGGGQRACFVRYAEGEWGAVHISTVASIAGRGVVQQILASRSLLDWPSRCLLWMKSKQDPRSSELACQLKLKVHAPESSQPKYSARRPRFSRCHTVELLAFALHPKKAKEVLYHPPCPPDNRTSNKPKVSTLFSFRGVFKLAMV